MDINSGDVGPQLTVVENVRCLECAAVYSKPSGGGTVRQNPGCPECGYVGWIAVGQHHAFTDAGRQPLHFDADQLLRPGG